MRVLQVMDVTVVSNPVLWEAYVDRLRHIRERMPVKCEASDHFKANALETVHPLDKSTNTFWLFHGTDESTAKILTTSGYE